MCSVTRGCAALVGGSGVGVVAVGVVVASGRVAPWMVAANMGTSWDINAVGRGGKGG